MTEMVSFGLGAFAHFAYSKGWLDTPIAFVAKTIKGCFGGGK